METNPTSDPAAIHRVITAELPTKARWMIREMPADFSFSASRTGPRIPSANDVGQDYDNRWSDLLIFGDVDYGDGGGAHPYLCVRTTDGRVVNLDVERLDAKGEGKAVSVLNSSVGAFIKSWAYLNQYLGQDTPLPVDAEFKMRLIDPNEYDRSDWKLLIDHLTADQS